MKLPFAAPLAICSLILLAPFSPINNKHSKSEKSVAGTKIVTINSSELEFANDKLLTLEDQHTSLSDFLEKNKGKVIYLDFWASWCRPCRSEMPSSRKLKEQFKDKEIVFIYLSLDSKVESWKKGSDQESLTTADNSFLLESAESSDIIKKLKINSIPRYVLFDKKGKIVNKDAPRPSDAKLITLLDKEIAKK